MSEAAQPHQPTSYIIPPPTGPNWKTPLLAIVLLGLIGSNIYLFTQLNKVRTDSRADMQKLSGEITSSIEKMKVDSSESVQRSRQTIALLDKQLRAQRVAANRAFGQAKVDAQQRVAALEQQVTDAQTKQQQAITEVKSTADAATKNLTTVTSDVKNARTELDQTIANLKRVGGDVDSQGSLIATNGKELAALRALGEKNYVDFTIPKSKEPQRVGDISMQLKKVDIKRNRYTLTIVADDKTVEKKDRTINEPVQFYTSKARQPYEIVVNQVKKNTIIGYLAIPKVLNPR